MIAATDLIPGVAYYYAGSENRPRPEPEYRGYVCPLPDHRSAYIFRGDFNRVFTLFGPDLLWLFRAESECWNYIGSRLESEATACYERARICRNAEERIAETGLVAEEINQLN